MYYKLHESEHTTNQFLLIYTAWVLNCHCFPFDLIQVLASKVRQRLTKTARWTVFLSSLTDYKAAWLIHLHTDTKKGISISSSIICLFHNRGSCSIFLPCAISHSVVVVVCRLMFLRFPLLVLNPGWVSFYSQYLVCLSFQRCSCRR